MGAKWSATCPSHSTPRGENPPASANLDVLQERTMLPLPGIEPLTIQLGVQFQYYVHYHSSTCSMVMALLITDDSAINALVH
jgi:hypothetical protein